MQSLLLVMCAITAAEQQQRPAGSSSTATAVAIAFAAATTATTTAAVTVTRLYLGGQLTLLPVLAVLSTFCAHTLEKHMRDDFMLRCDIAQHSQYIAIVVLFASIVSLTMDTVYCTVLYRAVLQQARRKRDGVLNSMLPPRVSQMLQCSRDRVTHTYVARASVSAIVH
eukprot:19030-Heterococcus_DN1.PRE.3